MQECVFIQSDIDKHGLETRFDIFDGAFEYAANNIEVAFTLEVVFLKRAVLNEGNTAFKLF